MVKFDYENLITSEQIFGIEFNHRGVKVIELDYRRDQAKLLGYGFSEYPITALAGDIIKDEDVVADALNKAMATAKPNKIRSNFVNVAIPDSKVFVRLVKFPAEMTKEEIHDSLQFKAKSLIAMPIESVYWDWHRIESSNNADSKEISVILAAADKECVDAIVRVLDKVGLKPLFFELGANALARMLFQGKPINKSVILVRVEADLISFGLYVDNGIRFNTVTKKGYNNIVSMLSTRTGIDSETMKEWILSPQNIPEDKIQIIRQSINETYSSIQDEITNVIEYWKNLKSSESISDELQVLIYGGGSELFGLKDFLAANKIDVNLAEPDKKFIDPVLQFLTGNKSFAHLTVIGLALRNSGPFKNIKDINLIPEEVKKNYIGKAIYSRVYKYARIIFWNVLILSIGMAGLFGYLLIIERNTNSEIKAVQNLTESKRNQEIESQIIYTNNLTSQIDKLLKREITYEEIYSSIEEVKPTNVTIENMNISENPDSYKTISGDKTAKKTSGVLFIIINGVAKERDDIILFSSGLNGIEYFENVQMPIGNFESPTDVKYSIYGKINVNKLQDK